MVWRSSWVLVNLAISAVVLLAMNMLEARSRSARAKGAIRMTAL
jgi:molybdate transport system permease protein